MLFSFRSGWRTIRVSVPLSDDRGQPLFPYLESATLNIAALQHDAVDLCNIFITITSEHSCDSFENPPARDPSEYYPILCFEVG